MNACIYKFRCCRIPGVGCFLICDLYHCESNDFIADLEAFLEDLCNDVFAKCFVFDVHDRVMKLRVKDLACRAEAHDAQLFHDGDELVHRHLDALFKRGILRLLRQRPLEIVIHGKEFFDRLRADVGVEAFLFLLAALAVVVVFGGQPQIAVMLLRQRLLRLFKLACLLLLGFLGLFFLGLLRGFGFGLLRSFFCLLGCGSGLCLFLRSRIAVCCLSLFYCSGSLCL